LCCFYFIFWNKKKKKRKNLGHFVWIHSPAFYVPMPMVMSTNRLVETEPAMEMLHRHFFPQWHAELVALCPAGGDPRAVAAWYSRWAAAIPRAWRDHPAVRFHLAAALRAVRTWLEGGRTRAARAPHMPAYAAVTTAVGLHTKPAGTTEMRAGDGAAPKYHPGFAGSDHEAVSMRDAVEALAARRGCEFEPAGRTAIGKQIFRLAGRRVYIDGDLVYLAGEDGAWAPASVHSIIPPAAAETA
jgi:hypothetical protein